MLFKKETLLDIIYKLVEQIDNHNCGYDEYICELLDAGLTEKQILLLGLRDLNYEYDVNHRLNEDFDEWYDRTYGVYFYRLVKQNGEVVYESTNLPKLFTKIPSLIGAGNSYNILKVFVGSDGERIKNIE